MKTYLQPEYIVERDEKRCIRCKVCVNQCTYETHFYDAETDTVCSKDENCVNCQRCVTFCPTHAITIKKEPERQQRKRQLDNRSNPRLEKASGNRRRNLNRYGLRQTRIHLLGPIAPKRKPSHQPINRPATRTNGNPNLPWRKT